MSEAVHARAWSVRFTVRHFPEHPNAGTTANAPIHHSRSRGTPGMT